MLLWNIMEEEQGSVIMATDKTWKQCGRQAGTGEGRGQEQMGELSSREMEQGNPKLI